MSLEFEAALEAAVGIDGTQVMEAEDFAFLEDGAVVFDEAAEVIGAEGEEAVFDFAGNQGVLEVELGAGVRNLEGALAGLVGFQQGEVHLVDAVVDLGVAAPVAGPIAFLGGSEGFGSAVIGAQGILEGAGFVLLGGELSGFDEELPVGVVDLDGVGGLGHLSAGALDEGIEEDAGVQQSTDGGGVGTVGIEEFDVGMLFAEAFPGEAHGGDGGVEGGGDFGVAVVERGLEFGAGFAAPGEVEEGFGVFALDFGVPEFCPAEHGGGVVDLPAAIEEIRAEGGLFLEDNEVPFAGAEGFYAVGDAPELREVGAAAGDGFGVDFASAGGGGELGDHAGQVIEIGVGVA